MTTTISPKQRSTIDAIVSVFETGQLPSAAAYGTVAILNDGAGISYGKHQATAASGTLAKILEEYLQLDGLYAGRLRPLLWLVPGTTGIGRDTPVSEPVVLLLDLLRSAGADPKMVQAQDTVFDAGYWRPTVDYCAKQLEVQTALSHLVIYDTWIQSGGGRVAQLREEFAALPPKRGGDEAQWTSQFLGARRDFLAKFVSSNIKRQTEVRASVYRIDAMLDLVHAGKWDLTTPLVVRRVRIE